MSRTIRANCASPFMDECPLPCGEEAAQVRPDQSPADERHCGPSGGTGYGTHKIRSTDNSERLHLTAAIAIVFASFLRMCADDLAQWLNTESTVSTSKVLNNILGNGAVIASRANPASGVCHPDYFYHWVRDGSLVMDTVVSMYAQAPDPASARGIWDYSRNTSTFRSACKIQII